MTGWTAIMRQAAGKLMNELGRLDPGNTALAFARSVFAEGDKDEAKGAADDQAAEDQALADLYVSGLTLTEAGKARGMSPTRVRSALIRLGIQRRPPGGHNAGNEHGPRDMARIERIRAARSLSPPKTLREIGAAEHITHERVRQICKANGIETRSPWAPPPC